MAKKRKLVYQEGYVKGITVDKDEIINLINMTESIIYINKVGKYDDNTETVTITIEHGTKRNV
jgi:hypothetical protein